MSTNARPSPAPLSSVWRLMNTMALRTPTKDAYVTRQKIMSLPRWETLPQPFTPESPTPLQASYSLRTVHFDLSSGDEDEIDELLETPVPSKQRNKTKESSRLSVSIPTRPLKVSVPTKPTRTKPTRRKSKKVKVAEIPVPNANEIYAPPIDIPSRRLLSPSLTPMSTLEGSEERRVRQLVADSPSIDGFAPEFGCSIGLLPDQQAELQSKELMQRPIEQQFTFITAQVMARNWSPWKIPTKATRLDDVAMKLLLDLTPDSLFNDSAINNFKLYFFLKEHGKDLGLGGCLRPDKIKVLELASQKSFINAHKKIIKKIKASIKKGVPLFGLAASLGVKVPSKRELNIFSLLRDEYLKNGKEGFFDKVDKRLTALRSSSNAKEQFRLLRREDASRFPEHRPISVPEKREGVEELADSGAQAGGNKHAKKRKRLMTRNR